MVERRPESGVLPLPRAFCGSPVPLGRSESALALTGCGLRLWPCLPHPSIAKHFLLSFLFPSFLSLFFLWYWGWSPGPCTVSHPQPFLILQQGLAHLCQLGSNLGSSCLSLLCLGPASRRLAVITFSSPGCLLFTGSVPDPAGPEALGSRAGVDAQVGAPSSPCATPWLPNRGVGFGAAVSVANWEGEAGAEAGWVPLARRASFSGPQRPLSAAG